MRQILCLLVLIGCSGDDTGPVPDGTAGGPDGANPPGPDARPPVADAANPMQPDAPVTMFPCEPMPTAGHQEIDCPDGVHFDVEASAACAAGGCGLILDIHGLTMTGDSEDAHTRMRTLGTAAGYVVIQPTSPGFLQEWSSGTYDDGVWSFLLATRERFAVDPDRVHVMGFSQGGMMTLRLLCDHSADLASVAPTAGGGCFEGGGGPSTNVPLLYTHGTGDNIITYSTGTAVRDGVIARYALGGPTDFATGPAYTGSSYANGANTILFEFWHHDFSGSGFGGGHCLPGPISGESYRCQDAGQYDHSVEVLRFFDAHPRP